MRDTLPLIDVRLREDLSGLQSAIKQVVAKEQPGGSSEEWIGLSSFMKGGMPGSLWRTAMANKHPRS